MQSLDLILDTDFFPGGIGYFLLSMDCSVYGLLIEKTRNVQKRFTKEKIGYSTLKKKNA
jgi:hypothetical protein